MAKNVLGMFKSVDEVNAVLKTLEVNGYTKDAISVVTSKDALNSDKVKFENNVVEGVKDSAKTGGVIGGILGLLVGVGALTIPGIGLLFVSGPIAAALGITGVAGATASGAIAGSLVGGIAGALKEIGVDEQLAVKYEEDLKQGYLIVGVTARDGDTQRIKDVFSSNGAMHISDLAIEVND
ncbi:MAG: low temperature-induced protein [Patescibacteria group bacterium]